MTLLPMVFDTLGRVRANGAEVIGWRFTQAHLETLWAEIHASWQQGKPMPTFDPAAYYEICGRPVTIMLDTPPLAIVSSRLGLPVTYTRPVC